MFNYKKTDTIKTDLTEGDKMEFGKAFDLFWQLYNENEEFKNLVKKGMKQGKIRFFSETEWKKIRSQNYLSRIFGVNEFIDLFIQGYNIGNCANMAMELSYSYDDVSIVSGILPVLKGTKNAEEVGGHVWLENDDTIIDTSLMLVISKSLKDAMGYIEEQRITKSALRTNRRYQSRKSFVNDTSLRKPSKK